MTTLFDSDPSPRSSERLEEGAVLLRGFATAHAGALVEEVARIAQAAPFRHLVTPGGYTMSVAMTNCGRVGWVSDRTGYRYDPVDPGTGSALARDARGVPDLAARAAAEAGFAHYDPDACLINRYIAGAKLGLHQDRDEKDAWAPIVSVSMGLPAVFLLGRQAPLRPGAPPTPRKRRRRGVGWSGTFRSSWGRSAQRRAASADGQHSHQSYLPKGVLGIPVKLNARFGGKPNGIPE